MQPATVSAGLETRTTADLEISATYFTTADLEIEAMPFQNSVPIGLSPQPAKSVPLKLGLYPIPGEPDYLP